MKMNFEKAQELAKHKFLVKEVKYNGKIYIPLEDVVLNGNQLEMLTIGKDDKLYVLGFSYDKDKINTDETYLEDIKLYEEAISADLVSCFDSAYDRYGMSYHESKENNLTNNFDYTQLADGSLKITKYKGSDTDVTIPSEIDGKKVTSIEKYAFLDCRNLTSITIPDSVISIGNYAFKSCSSLTNITIPNSVTSIGYNAFMDCTNLTSITIPDNVTSIGGYAFWGCESLTNITIPDSVTSIENGTFGGCTSLTSITIPNSVTSIGTSAFYGCANITNITIPNSVTSIGDSAFGGCTSLINVTIPNSVTSIEKYAFWDCKNLTSVTIPDGVTSIEDDVFEGCENLKEIILPADCCICTDEGGYYLDCDNFHGCSAKIVRDSKNKSKSHNKEFTMSRKDLKATADRVHNQPKLEQTKNKEIEL